MKVDIKSSQARLLAMMYDALGGCFRLPLSSHNSGSGWYVVHSGSDTEKGETWECPVRPSDSFLPSMGAKILIANKEGGHEWWNLNGTHPSFIRALL
jgi:hypothetical protein